MHARNEGASDRNAVPELRPIVGIERDAAARRAICAEKLEKAFARRRRHYGGQNGGHQNQFTRQQGREIELRFSIEQGARGRAIAPINETPVTLEIILDEINTHGALTVAMHQIRVDAFVAQECQHLCRQSICADGRDVAHLELRI